MAVSSSSKTAIVSSRSPEVVGDRITSAIGAAGGMLLLLAPWHVALQIAAAFPTYQVCASKKNMKTLFQVHLTR